MATPPGNIPPTGGPKSTARRLVQKCKEALMGLRPASKRKEATVTKDITITPWDTLRIALRKLERIAETFPLLKAAVDDIIILSDLVREAATRHSEYDGLVQDFEHIAQTLNRYIEAFDPSDHSENVEYITKALKVQISYLAKKRNENRAKPSGLLKQTEIQDDVIKCHNETMVLFQTLQCEISHRVWKNMDIQRIRGLLKDMCPVEDARYNSGFSMIIRRRSCTKGTRVAVQEQVLAWAQNSSSAQIYWMNGMAGTGKTTIAYTLCERFADTGLLGANFFCSRSSASCSGGNQIIPTIANQLAHYSHAFRSELCKVLQEDGSVCFLDVEQQFKKLVLQPMLAVKAAIPAGVIVVVDALDECQESYIVKEFLRLLLSFSIDLPIKFFVTSRPEPTIRGSMMAEINYPPSVLHLHDIQDTIVQGDIQIYLEEALESMSPPPSEDEIRQLVERSGKLFIYAATVARYIISEKLSVDPRIRFKKVLTAGPGEFSKDRRPIKELDELYTTILQAAFNEDLDSDEVEGMQLILHTILCAKEPVNLSVLKPIMGLEYTSKQLQCYLEPLRSVLHVSEADGMYTVSTFHASFLDFMFDKERSDKFHCDNMRHNSYFAIRCFQVMSEQLHFNMCSLELSTAFDSAVQNLKQRSAQIDQGLLYSCRFWAEHLQEAGSCDVEKNHEGLISFLSCRFLFWVEVLNLADFLVIAKEVLSQARGWLLANHISGAIATWVADAIEFVAFFASGTCFHSTPHLYLSALPSFRKSSFIYSNYYSQMRGLVDIHSYITPNDHRINEGKRSKDIGGSTVTLTRDILTGAVVTGPFKLQTGGLQPTSVALSIDGIYAVIASVDHTISVYDTQTGVHISGPLQGHADAILSLAISINKVYIVSGSSDRRLGVWNMQSGVIPIGLGEGHTESVTSVNLSADGSRVISGSADCAVLVWDTNSCTIMAGPFKSHNGVVTAVAFSPDCSYIVSGSVDHTILVCDTLTGAVMIEPVKLHTSWVTSLAFSPDGTRIASGSADQTIWIIDVNSGDAVAGPLRGHTRLITFVTFSPDGTRIVSASEDCTSRVWAPDPRCKPQEPLLAIPHRLEDGWLINNNDELILWVPPELHPYCPRFLCEFAMDFQGASRTSGWDQMILGNQWVECYPEKSTIKTTQP
ncbi:putative WD repeat-containing protein alr3466 [Nostoc sp, PCC 7120] [Rhizoctonia solani]|uniref:Putative WD repeat-containing protein alr3466 [Nostoc sp, PCC 7120] n=1 Tax=Rhizoctonia solani TaxID=456999 RepID=A0A0K6FZU0_9AGAM|nr:putative WD repeat-containing protein alr3466 [Nostoc sp, PCC 7120] [Rhizoctonia solani]